MADPLLYFGGGFGVFQFLKDGLRNQDLTKKGGQQIHFVNQYQVIQWGGIGNNDHAVRSNASASFSRSSTL